MWAETTHGWRFTGWIKIDIQLKGQQSRKYLHVNDASGATFAEDPSCRVVLLEKWRLFNWKLNDCFVLSFRPCWRLRARFVEASQCACCTWTCQFERNAVFGRLMPMVCKAYAFSMVVSAVTGAEIQHGESFSWAGLKNRSPDFAFVSTRLLSKLHIRIGKSGFAKFGTLKHSSYWRGYSTFGVMVVNTVHWFRKGLRFHDNPSLRDSIIGADTLRCVYILDPWFAGSSNVGISRWRWVAFETYCTRVRSDLHWVGVVLYVYCTTVCKQSYALEMTICLEYEWNTVLVV